MKELTLEELHRMRTSQVECEQLDKYQAQLLTTSVMIEKESIPSTIERIKTDLYETSTYMIINARIEGFKLPISFTPPAILAIIAYTKKNPGKTVTILIDCLNNFSGGEEVTVSKLINIYPWGFYKEENFRRYIDEVLKERKIPWAHIY